jgi:hypothetical protein
VNTHDQKSGAERNDGGICNARVVDQVADEGNYIRGVKRVPHHTVKATGFYAPIRREKTETSAQRQQGYDCHCEATDLQDFPG